MDRTRRRIFGHGDLDRYSLAEVAALKVLAGLECRKCRKFAAVDVDELTPSTLSYQCGAARKHPASRYDTLHSAERCGERIGVIGVAHRLNVDRNLRLGGSQNDLLGDPALRQASVTIGLRQSLYMRHYR